MKRLFFVLCTIAMLGSLAKGALAENSQKELDESLKTTPHTEYGSFNEDEDEAEYTKFLQFGRFFGLSAGLGYHNATGNRGLLWNGGFPTVDLRIHYWFDFSFAFNIGFSSASHFYSDPSGGVASVSLTNFGFDLKYYFDVRNLSAPLTFAGPYLMVGGGTFTKVEALGTTNVVDPETKFGFSFGAGLEFPIEPKKTYFFLEARASVVSFSDAFSSTFDAEGIPDLTGAFYSVTANVLFTW